MSDPGPCVDPELTRRLSRLDLNLLVVLDALLAERHVTRAGTRVGLSQPAVSQALARLRKTLGDPLLVRSPSGMVPTPRALELAGPLRHLLGNLDRLLAPPRDFDPSEPRVFRLALSDYAGCVLLPPLIEALTERGPGIDLEVLPFTEASRHQELEAGTVDFSIEYFAQLAPGLHRLPLLEEGFLCVVRRDHPGVGEDLDLATYAALPHVLVSPRGGGGKGIVDQVLEEHGLARRLVLNIPHFLVTPLLVARSELVVTLPARIAELVAELHGLRTLPTPVPIPGFTLEAVWHPRLHEDSGACWFRELLAEVARGI